MSSAFELAEQHCREARESANQISQPKDITLAERPKVDELGGAGTSYFSGSLAENEYNSELRGLKGITIYEKMRRSDARVKFALLICELPIRAVEWSVEPASDDEQDVEIADALQENLFNMSITWDSFLHHAAGLMLAFGFSVFEKVWEIKDGRVQYRKFAPRLPQTLYQWDLDDNGGLKGIVQFTQKGNRYEQIPIPAEKLLVFTNEKEGSNFEGVSVLRTAYKHWYYKDNLYRIDGIAAERHAVGVPVFTTPGNAKQTTLDEIDKIGQRMYAQEQQYVRLGEGYGVDIKGLVGTIRDIMPSIQHHNRAIAESVLADFIDLGSADKGSWALSKDKSSLFLMSLNAVATNISDTINTYAIPQWVDYNYSGINKYPKLKAGSFETRDMVAYADAVSKLLTAGGLTYSDDLENSLRDGLGMEEKPENTAPPEPGTQPSDEPPNPAEPNPVTSTNTPVVEEAEKKRELTVAEKFVAFDEIGKRLDQAEEEFIKASKDIQAQQIDNLVDETAKIVEGKLIRKAAGIEVRYKTQMADKFYSVLKSLLAYGREQVKKELAAQKMSLAEPTPINPEDAALIEEFLRARSKASVNQIAAKLKQQATYQALKQIKEGVLDKAAVRQGLTDLSDRELIAAAKYSCSEAFNWGRSQAAKESSDEIASTQYSAILDNKTCEVCAPLDGQEWDFQDERTARYASGNPDCMGGGRCRCLLIYIYKSERRNP
jgi:phage gp29-like protein